MSQEFIARAYQLITSQERETFRNIYTLCVLTPTIITGANEQQKVHYTSYSPS